MPTSTAKGSVDDEAPPPFSRTQLEFLQKIFPNRLPDITTSDRELGALIGQQRVIAKIAGILRQQEEDYQLPNVL